MSEEGFDCDEDTFTITGGTSFCGYMTDATVSGGSTIASLTLSSMITTYYFSGSMGGGRPGGNGGQPGGNGSPDGRH